MRKTYTPDRLTRADKLAQKIIAKVEELFVKKDGNKVLSTNDYTTAEKKKLAGLSEGATKTAKSTTNGNILIDNEETTVYTHPTSAAGAKAEGLYKIATDKEGHVTAATAVAKTDITTLGIPGSDTVYTHPTSAAGAKASGLYKITTDATGHVTGAEEVVKADITALDIPERDTTYEDATIKKSGLMSAEDKAKTDAAAAFLGMKTFKGVIYDSAEMETAYRGAIQPGDWWLVNFDYNTPCCFGPTGFGSGSIIIAYKEGAAGDKGMTWGDNFSLYAKIINQKNTATPAIFVPSGGKEGQILKCNSNGFPIWADA